MKGIVSKVGWDAKLRLRGKGSGYLERDTKEESSEPLQLCVSCPRQDGYFHAKDLVYRLIEDVYHEYQDFSGSLNPIPVIRCIERHVPGAGGDDEDWGRRRGGVQNGGLKKDNQRGKKRKESIRFSSEDRGEPPPGAPSVEEIAKKIQERNEARKSGDYKGADAIRDSLKDMGVVLSDEKGGRGEATRVTTWRYWQAEKAGEN